MVILALAGALPKGGEGDRKVIFVVQNQYRFEPLDDLDRRSTRRKQQGRPRYTAW